MEDELLDVMALNVCTISSVEKERELIILACDMNRTFRDLVFENQ